MKNLFTAIIAATVICGPVIAESAKIKGPNIVKFDAEIDKWARRAGKSGCTHVSYKLNDEGDVYAVKVLGSKGHKSFAREALYAVREMQVEPGSAAGSYDLVVDFSITRRTASNSEQTNDAFERDPKVCPFTAKTDHEPILVSGQRDYRVAKPVCDNKGVGSNMKAC